MHHVVDETLVAGEEQAGERRGMRGGDLAGGARSRAEHTLASLLFVLRVEGLVTDAVGESEAAVHLPAVLRVEAGDVIAVVEVLAGCLLEGGEAAEQEIGESIGDGGIGVELED